jgi:hypothetical protein
MRGYHCTALQLHRYKAHGQEYTDKTVYTPALTRGGLIKMRGDMGVNRTPIRIEPGRCLKGRSAKFLELYRNRG